MEDKAREEDEKVSILESDTDWELNLPHDWEEIFCWSKDALQCTTKNELYSILCKGIPMNDGELVYIFDIYDSLILQSITLINIAVNVEPVNQHLLASTYTVTHILIQFTVVFSCKKWKEVLFAISNTGFGSKRLELDFFTRIKVPNHFALQIKIILLFLYINICLFNLQI